MSVWGGHGYAQGFEFRSWRDFQQVSIDARMYPLPGPRHISFHLVDFKGEISDRGG